MLSTKSYFEFLQQTILFLNFRTPQEKMARLAVLLSLQQPPTRQSLIKDAARFGIVQVSCYLFVLLKYIIGNGSIHTVQL